MRWLRMLEVVTLVAVTSVCVGSAARADELLAWGDDSSGQVSNLPAGADYVAVAAGDAHGLALTSDGTVMAWGANADGQRDLPPGAYDAIGAGARFSLAVRSNGSIAAWGDDDAGQVSGVPAGNNYVAVDGGLHFAVALRNNGAVVAWGDDRYGQVSGTPRGNDFVAVVAGDAHAVALRSNGSLETWGYWGATEDMPTTGVYVAISAGGNQSVALRDDGTIVWWGDAPDAFDLDDVPVGRDFVDVAAGYLHALAIRKDGSAVGWGAGMKNDANPHLGQADPPARNDYTAIAGGLLFSVALTATSETGGISDDFDDNRQGDMWSLVGDDLSACWLDEVNRRLDLRATNKADSCSVFYFSNGWAIDPGDDFALRVDFHQDLRLGDSASLSIVLTPDIDNRRQRFVEFGVGSRDSTPFFRLEAIDDSVRRSQLKSRTQADGTLYVSYDASLDELYVSERGFGAANAWSTVRGLLGGAWGGGPVLLGLGGGSDRLAIDSGQAYLDDFVLEKGDPAVTGLSNVYRFWSPVLGNHFYTISEAERDKLIKEFSDVWIFEGAVFQAAPSFSDADLAPVYRFWSPVTSTHFLTISEKEKDRLIKELPRVWTFEGVVFYAHPEGQPPAGTKPVYVFASKVVTNAYFYTISEKEKNRIITTFADAFSFEGIAFYAYE